MNEKLLPALYMVWPKHRLTMAPQVETPGDYLLRPYRADDEELVLALLSAVDGWSIPEEQWRDYQDRLLPKGLYLAFHGPSATLVGTAGAVHNPRGGRYYFPFGGELAYLLVHPAHRSHGLGKVLCAHVVQRFLSAGYDSIHLGVQGWRLPAVKTYLATGFVPFLYQPDAYSRWERICQKIGS